MPQQVSKSNAGHFFQTSSSIEQSERRAKKARNKSGAPIQLASKLLAVLSDPHDAGRVFVAESAGSARRVLLDNGNKAHSYNGPTAPLTSLAMTATELFAGCWDFTVWAWDIETRASTRRLRGHSDFVKALAIAPRKAAGEKGFLVSGGADASIIVWDLETGAKLRTLKGHGRGIECLIFDDFDVKQRLIWSGGSEREIRNWKLDGQGLREGMKEPLIRHETNIYRVVVDDEGDLWTASADRTVKALARARGWEVDLELAHPDYVRDVLVDEIGGLIVTACRDEEVRVWNRGTGDLVHTFSGHFEEVMGLALLPGQKVVSVSIDGTIRQWSLSPKDLEAAKKEAASPRSDVEEKKEDKTTLTAAEEEELAELMGDAE